MAKWLEVIGQLMAALLPYLEKLLVAWQIKKAVERAGDAKLVKKALEGHQERERVEQEVSGLTDEQLDDELRRGSDLR